MKETALAPFNLAHPGRNKRHSFHIKRTNISIYLCDYYTL